MLLKLHRRVSPYPIGILASPFPQYLAVTRTKHTSCSNCFHLIYAQLALYKCISIPAKVRIFNADFGAASLKGFQLQGASPPDHLTRGSAPGPGALPLDPAGGSAPDPRYRLALRARHGLEPP